MLSAGQRPQNVVKQRRLIIAFEDGMFLSIAVIHLVRGDHSSIRNNEIESSRCPGIPDFLTQHLR